ncbi:zinc finger protein 488 [Scleropages formosus]|uniref:Zinc finger protein 488 n=1 Tax=Scleropages formosus TaxID=113540 RepID=A0A8C9S073_SCLFO|nr:PR domain zinc finger protein 8-like [Scleropages formosus]
MELGILPRSLWTSDAKFQHQHLTDLLTSVQVTRDLPLGATLGPCILHSTFYDTIAFIALKSCDKRNKSYIFRVDAEAMNSSLLVLSWLRLVQAASNKDEQNMEAFLKGGQLYFRSLRDIRKEEELLVWYDDELSSLLGFNDIKARIPTSGLKCMNCNQSFRNEHPYLAHCRFLCGHVKHGLHCRGLNDHETVELKEQLRHRVTDFHNIARDLEHRKCGVSDDTLRKRRQDEAESPRARKCILLEKTNISNGSHKDTSAVPELTVSVMKLNADAYLLCKDLPACKQSAFTEVKSVKNETETDTVDDRELERSVQIRAVTNVASHTSGSAFSFVLPKGTREEQKSAFCKPHKRTANEPHPLSGSSERLEDMSDTISSKAVLGYNTVFGSAMLSADMSATQSMPASLGPSSPFPFAADPWSRPAGVPLQGPSSLTLLPPTFTSFGVSVQNWCAKCNLSFRMTSDLVFHMRSHHKKEFAAESQVRRREEKLTCPICHEYFRERHHLSRHMTSHN